MKKHLYILAILLLSLGFVGCHKLDIKPHSCEDDRGVENFEKGKDSDDDDDFDRDGDGEVITDPNHDEDEDQQKKR